MYVRLAEEYNRRDTERSIRTDRQQWIVFLYRSAWIEGELISYRSCRGAPNEPESVYGD